MLVDARPRAIAKDELHERLWPSTFLSEATDPARVANRIIYNGREQSLAEGEHVLGRDADVALPLSSSTVSRHHARITINRRIATLEDRGSKNGTYPRGQAVTSPTLLADGDRIRIGAFELTFRTLAAPGSTETQQ